MSDLESRITYLEGQTVAMRTLADALIISHPNPRALRAAWDELSASTLVGFLQAAQKQKTEKKAETDSRKKSIEDRIAELTALIHAASNRTKG